jgi:hypothetical protein
MLQMWRDRCAIGTKAVFLIVLLQASLLLAQDNSAQEQDKSWSKSTDLNAAGVVPTRVRESHQNINGRTVDTRVLEKQSVNGGWEPYDETETETIQVDRNTVRVVERRFGRNPDGSRTVTGVSEEQRQRAENGRETSVRTVSAPDVNGNFAVTQKVTSEAVKTGPDTQQVTTTVMTPSVNGGLAVSSRKQRVEQQDKSGNTSFRESTQERSVNGDFVTGEVREGVVQQNADKSSKAEQRVSRADINGNMSVTERTVTNEWQAGPGDRRQEIQVFSQAPGSSTGSPLQIVRQVTGASRSNASGDQISERHVQQLRPGLPDEGLGTTQVVVDFSQPTGVTTRQENQSVQTNQGGAGIVISLSSQKTEQPQDTGKDAKASGTNPR